MRMSTIRFGNRDWVAWKEEGDLLYLRTATSIGKFAWASDSNMYWSGSDIRHYLNTDFIDTFSNDELKKLVVVPVTTNTRTLDDIDKTEDYVWLDSVENIGSFYYEHPCASTLLRNPVSGISNGVWYIGEDGWPHIELCDEPLDVRPCICIHRKDVPETHPLQERRQQRNEKRVHPTETSFSFQVPASFSGSTYEYINRVIVPTLKYATLPVTGETKSGTSFNPRMTYATDLSTQRIYTEKPVILGNKIHFADVDWVPWKYSDHATYLRALDSVVSIPWSNTIGYNWSNSALRQFLNVEFYHYLPDYIRSNLLPVMNWTRTRDGNFERTQDKVWVHSVEEIKYLPETIPLRATWLREPSASDPVCSWRYSVKGATEVHPCSQAFSARPCICLKYNPYGGM